MLIDGTKAAAATGSPNILPLFWWQGWTGRWYVTSVFDLSRFECNEEGAFILVRRERSGRRVPLFVGASRAIGDELYDVYGDQLMRAIAAGANEVHVHLALSEEDTPADVRRDLATGWGTASERSLALV